MSIGPDFSTPANNPPIPAQPLSLPRLQRQYLAPGFAILAACLVAGEQLKAALGLILPGNILGLFILLALLLTGVVPVRWVEGAARLMLWLLPLLFMPIFILTMKSHAFWLTEGKAVAGAAAGGTVLLWALTGWAAQRLLRGHDEEPNPKP